MNRSKVIADSKLELPKGETSEAEEEKDAVTEL